MSKKAFKKLVISRGGDIINNKKFKYKNKIYLFHYFLKDSDQRGLNTATFDDEYQDDLIECSKYGISKNLYFPKKENSTWKKIFEWIDFIFWFGIYVVSIVISLILNLLWFPFELLFSNKNQYADLNTRINELNLWSKAYIVNNKEAKSTKKIKKIKWFKKIKQTKDNQEIQWAFKKIMINDYIKINDEKELLTLDNYIALKKAKEKRQLVFHDDIKIPS